MAKHHLKEAARSGHKEMNDKRIVGETPAGRETSIKGGRGTMIGPMSGTRSMGKGPSLHVDHVDAHKTGYSHHAGRAPYHDAPRDEHGGGGEGAMWKNR